MQEVQEVHEMQDLDDLVFVSRASPYRHEVHCQPLTRLGNGRYGFPKVSNVSEEGSACRYGLYNSASSRNPHGVCRGEVHFRGSCGSYGLRDEFEIMPNEHIVFHGTPSHMTYSKFQWCYALHK